MSVSMPDHLVLVRHGESTGNVAVEAAKNGDLSFHTEEFMTTPGHRWRLTPTGQDQAASAGAFLSQAFPSGFDRYLVSPYVRTRQTAATLGLLDASWLMNRALRERDWGDIGSIPRSEFKSRPEFELNYAHSRRDPLYWVPPGGESIANVAEDRVRNVLSTLHRECSGQSVLAVTHGEVMWSFRLVLERLDDERFIALDADPQFKIVNCEVHHYTRVDPVTQVQAPRLEWVRTAAPVWDGSGWAVRVSPWRKFTSKLLSNEQLLAGLDHAPDLWV